MASDPTSSVHMLIDDPLALIERSLARLPKRMDSKIARLNLYAIGLQESGFKHRAQVTNGGFKGPARGFWQFERGGGCKGVVEHPASRFWMHGLCMEDGVKFNATELWHAIEFNDELACCAARLLLFTDPRPLSMDINECWRYYKRVWRPGKPHEDRWMLNFKIALEAAF